MHVVSVTSESQHSPTHWFTALDQWSHSTPPPPPGLYTRFVDQPSSPPETMLYSYNRLKNNTTRTNVPINQAPRPPPPPPPPSYIMPLPFHPSRCRPSLPSSTIAHWLMPLPFHWSQVCTADACRVQRTCHLAPSQTLSGFPCKRDVPSPSVQETSGNTSMCLQRSLSCTDMLAGSL